MNTPNAPYRYEPHEGDGCVWWTVRCDGSPEILNVGAAVERLNEQHAEIERLREEQSLWRDRLCIASAKMDGQHVWRLSSSVWPPLVGPDADAVVRNALKWASIQPLPAPPVEEE